MSDHALDHAVMRALEHDGVDYRNRYNALVAALDALEQEWRQWGNTPWSWPRRPYVDVADRLLETIAPHRVS